MNWLPNDGRLRVQMTPFTLLSAFRVSRSTRPVILPELPTTPAAASKAAFCPPGVSHRAWNSFSARSCGVSVAELPHAPLLKSIGLDPEAVGGAGEFAGFVSF